MSMDMEIDSPNYNRSDTSAEAQLQDSPLLNASVKSRPLRPASHQRTNSLKRPLTMSPKVDSPTCSVLAADFSSNFHVNSGHLANPKKILLPSMMGEENKENAKKMLYRKGKRLPAFKSDSLASSFYHHRSNSSSSLVAGSQSSIFHNRSKSQLDTSTPIAIPPPTQVSPETQSIIGNSRLKKSFSLINPQYNSFNPTESSSSSENEDSDHDDECGRNEVGSPLQQKNRSHSRSRMELNSDIKNKLQRATSMIQPPGPAPKPKLFKLSTSSFDGDTGALSAGTTQLANTINELNFGRDGFPLESRRIDKLHLDESPVDFGPGNSVLAKSPVSTFFVDDCTLPRINVDQFHEILVSFKEEDKQTGKNKYREYFDELMVVDCRFEYEFKGGHIDCALNVSSKKELEELLLGQSVIKKTPMEHTAECRKLLIFHCEFSSHRGPLMANLLRTWDRYLNKEYYPHLYYPDIVILEGGYKKFYERFNGVHCYPLNYIEMHDPQFKDECETGLYKLRKDSKLSLNRKSSFQERPGSLSLRKSYTSTSVLSFAESTKSTTSIFSFAESKTEISELSGDGELGGFGSSISLDDLCDESPIAKKGTMLKTSPVSKPKFEEFKKPQSPQKLFKLPNLPHRKTLHFRSKTVGSLTSTPPHFPHFSDLTRRFEKHVDTPIIKK
ncbi:hypothetical protein KL942_003870 [Ogataea angusta]|uniref:protein-tyrosine-phosphatase n=1 Tax=Pichia angusta TaxID=870730 RepID=A0ABQ7RVI6_PICAN|nr:hypothetical protein KL942_003870 [Ogataea angusta]KAG7848520.1 hypothetical protein KL940_003375 [Ogataea angusta]